MESGRFWGCDWRSDTCNNNLNLSAAETALLVDVSWCCEHAWSGDIAAFSSSVWTNFKNYCSHSPVRHKNTGKRGPGSRLLMLPFYHKISNSVGKDLHINPSNNHIYIQYIHRLSWFYIQACQTFGKSSNIMFTKTQTQYLTIQNVCRILYPVYPLISH